jgi:hypothetical protein
MFEKWWLMVSKTLDPPKSSLKRRTLRRLFLKRGVRGDLNTTVDFSNNL